MKKPKTYRFTAPLEKMNAQMAFMYVELPIDLEQEYGTMPCPFAGYYGSVHQ